MISRVVPPQEGIQHKMQAHMNALHHGEHVGEGYPIKVCHKSYVLQGRGS